MERETTTKTTSQSPLSDLLEDYRRIHPDAPKLTLENIAYGVAIWERLMGPIPIGDITDDRFAEFAEKLKTHKGRFGTLKRSTVSKFLNIVFMLMRLAGPLARGNRIGLGIVQHRLSRRDEMTIISSTPNHEIRARHLVSIMKKRGHIISDGQALVALHALGLSVRKVATYLDLAIRDLQKSKQLPQDDSRVTFSPLCETRKD